MPTAKKPRPPAKKTAARKPAANKSVTKKPAAKKVAANKSAGSKSVTTKGGANKVVAKKPVAKTAARKVAAKKPVARKSAGKAPTSRTDTRAKADPTPSFMVTALASELGAPDPALLAALLQETPDSELIDRGTQIGSLKVVTDGTRMFGLGWTFYKTATAEQKEQLRGCSRELFVLGVAETLRLETLLNQQTAQQKREGGTREVNAVTQDSAWTYAMNLRDQAEEVLRSAAGSRKARAAVSEAVGTAESSMTLALGLEALAELLEGWLEQAASPARATQALKLRLELFALDADYAHKLRQAAEALRKSAADVQNRPQTARVSQVQLDRQDGLCLFILDRVMRAFERGHALDSTIPRLVPLATRRVLGRVSSPSKSKPAEPTPAASPSPAAG